MKSKLVKRMISLCLAGVMALSLMGCQSKETTKESEKQESQAASESKEATSESKADVASESTAEDLPLTYPVDTDTKVSLWVGNELQLYSGFTSVEESPIHTGLSEKTGIDIDWKFLPKGADKDQSYNLLWTEAEQPHMIMNWYSDNVATGQLLQDELIWDLTDYVEEYAPDFWEYMNRPENDFLLKSLTTDDGKILKIPQVQEEQYNQTYAGFFIRQDWLDECGLDTPVTIADWEKTLAAFKEKYNAGLAYVGDYANASGFIASGFDALGYQPDNLAVRDGKITFAPVEDEYKAMMETLVQWWEKGYIDQDNLTLDASGVRTKALNGNAGIVLGPMSQFGNIVADAEAENNGANWVGIPYPRVAEGQPTSMIMTSASRLPGYAVVITKSASEEEMKTCLQFLNYAFTEEGIMFLNFGEEGVSYEVDANGDYQFTEAVKNDPLGMNEACKKYSFHATGCYGIQLAKMVKAKNIPVVGAAPEIWAENTEADEHCLPSISLTQEEWDSIVDILVAISTYSREESAKFLSGERDIAEYDTYVEELYDMGLQDWIDAYQSAYDRFCAK